MEPGETPEIAVEREVLEEIGYQITNPQKFGCYNDDRANRHIFYAPLTVTVDQLILTEGWDLGLITSGQIEAGLAYSSIAGAERPVGGIHQQIMLEFIEWWGG
jgi:8-oxo-dGTP diphosphatase